jgi:hypothetical protein
MSGPLFQIARLQRMDDRTWARHANPLSGWTRVPILPLICAAIFWRDALGVWLYPLLGALMIWAWVNPRAFPPPRTTRSWMSKAVMGERVWLARDRVPVPLHYRRAVPIILGFAVAGVPLIALGLWYQAAWPLVLGLTLSLLGKFWFLDRMVWLYDDMSAGHPIYRAWLH